MDEVVSDIEKDNASGNLSNAFNNDSLENDTSDLSKLDMLNDVTINLKIEIGRSVIKIRDLLNLSKGSILELDKSTGDSVDVYANDRLIAKGMIVTANGKYCVKLTSLPE